MDRKYRRVKYACYMTSATMAVTCNLSPLLFLTLRSLYGISYSLLGLLVLVNFVTQLAVDLAFSFFSHRFPIERSVRLTPVLAAVGLVLYAAAPILFPNAVYFGLLVGTVIFSASSGLAEVLISPTIAAIPAKNPDREMSKLHSVYAWGSVFMVLFSTLYLFVCGHGAWQWLVLIVMSVPLVAALLFWGTEIPLMSTPERASGAFALLKNRGFLLSVLAIFLGGAAECTMSQWASGYLEGALGLDKLWGDVLGVAMFALMLGVGRTLYAKCGRNIARVLFLGSIGASACYLVAALTPVPILGLVACALTGLCTSMLWPGSLIVASDRFPTGGVFMFAMMAAGGDLGASIGPQLVGIVTDAAIANPRAVAFATELGIGAEQLGMKLGMLVGALFPILAIGAFARLHRTKKHDT